MKSPRLLFAVLSALLLSAPVVRAATAPEVEPGFISLFNGRNLDGWVPKMAKHAAGENYADTFRVEDGVIKVSYDKYPIFEEQFGHLYSVLPYSHYILRMDYLFTGKPMADSPPWAKFNSGVMIHSQSPYSMTREQLWPASLEFQFLCTGTAAGRQTGNVCTPGTNIVFKDKFTTDHILEAHDSVLSPLDTWVSIELEVHGNDEVIHRVNGQEVLRYTHPQLDPKEASAQALMARGQPLQLEFGHLALQAESQPVWFRNIRIKPLDR